MKLLGQRNPPMMDSLNREVDDNCKRHGGWGARLDGKVNVSEQPINAVNCNRPKTLIGLSQKAK